jgi:hypothetical protein
MTDNYVPPTAAHEPPTATHRGDAVSAAPHAASAEGAATEGAATESATVGAVELRIDRDEAQALLLAIDALTPLLERIRQEVAPEPEPEPESEAPATVATPDFDDALHRATRLARQSLREARVAIGRGHQSAEQRRAWQEAARRYVAARASRRTGTGSSGR